MRKQAAAFSMRRQPAAYDDLDRMMAEPFGMMNRMNNMMNQMLGSAYGPTMLGGYEHPAAQQQHAMRQRAQPSYDPLALNIFQGGFGGGLMGMMDHAMHDPHSTVFSQSTMIMQNPDGTQRVVSNSTRKTGDIKETRHALRDGDEERVSVGHHIGDRTHVIEKKRDKDGQFRQNQRFVNLDENDAKNFDTEFKQRAHRNLRGLYTSDGGAYDGRHAIEGGGGGHTSGKRSSRPRHDEAATANSSSAQPIVEVPDDDADSDVQYLGTSRHGGPTIRELSEEEADAEQRSKRRRGVSGWFRANDV